MPFSFLTSALLVISVITNLTVEGIKKILDGSKINYSSNLLAAVTAVFVALFVSIIYIIMTDVVVTIKVMIEVAVLMYFGFIISTVGYDKVIQMLQQIRVSKGG